MPKCQAPTLINSMLNLTWSLEAGGTNQFQSNAGFDTPNWTNLANPLTATGEMTSFTDFSINTPHRFYRLALAQ